MAYCDSTGVSPDCEALNHRTVLSKNILDCQATISPQTSHEPTRRPTPTVKDQNEL